jgi:hypothetical protein
VPLDDGTPAAITAGAHAQRTAVAKKAKAGAAKARLPDRPTRRYLLVFLHFVTSAKGRLG